MSNSKKKMELIKQAKPPGATCYQINHGTELSLETSSSSATRIWTFEVFKV